MQITEVRKSCTCLDFVPLTKTLQPNETAELVVTMNTGKFVGFNAQTFYVTFGPKYVSTAVLRVAATSRTDVSINPGGIAFGTVAHGTRPTQSVNIKYSGKMRDWKLTEVAPVQGPFDVKVTEVSRGGPFRGGAEYQVEVTLKPTAKAGPHSETAPHQDHRPGAPRRAGHGDGQRRLAARDRPRQGPLRHRRGRPVGLAASDRPRRQAVQGARRGRRRRRA